MFNSILVVCVGNICRSPVAEYLFKDRLKHLGKEIFIESAGLGALTGKPAHPDAIQTVSSQLDLTPHIAQQLTAELIVKHDLILVMEEGHITACEQLN